jgi:anti-sigma factor RsiW
MSHLTEDQIDELLMGSLEADEAARLREHAAGCEACAAQLAEIEAPIASFKAVSLAWGERRSATLPVRPAARSQARWGMGFAWGSLAAVALLAAFIPVLRHQQNVHQQQAQNKIQPSTPAVQTANSTVAVNNNSTANSSTDVPENTHQIASDNRMLAMVDEELNAPLPSLNSATHGRGHSRASTPAPIQD